MRTTRLFKLEFYAVITKTSINFKMSRVSYTAIDEIVAPAIFSSYIIDDL